MRLGFHFKMTTKGSRTVKTDSLIRCASKGATAFIVQDFSGHLNGINLIQQQIKVGWKNFSMQ